LTEAAFHELVLPVKRLAAADVPTPYNRQLELASIPDVNAVINTIQTLVKEKDNR
jgi:pyruvate/2-oxoglutarate/acetoin dehydrogenase E1 component